MFDRRAQLMALQNMRRGGGQAPPAQSNLAGAMAPVMGAPQPPPQGLAAAAAPVMGPPPPQQSGGMMNQYAANVMGPPQQGPTQPAQRRGQGRPRPMGGGL
jgi:hypothetical protein